MSRVQANKQYGQHFLKDESVVEQTLSLVRKYYPGGKILEVGPGTGALTKALLQDYEEHLSCIEVDKRCVAYLHENYPVLKDKIIQSDFLKVPLEEIAGDNALLIGNFPYNISSQIVFKLLENKELFPVMIGMFQKEVAERIAASHGSKTYGILSVLTQTFYDAEICFEIPPEAFDPPPKVQSSVLLLKRKGAFPEGLNEKLLRQIVKSTFNQRRKMIRKALKYMLPEDVLTEDFYSQRVEQLSVEDFIELSKRVDAYSRENKTSEE